MQLYLHINSKSATIFTSEQFCTLTYVIQEFYQTHLLVCVALTVDPQPLSIKRNAPL